MIVNFSGAVLEELVDRKVKVTAADEAASNASLGYCGSHLETVSYTHTGFYLYQITSVQFINKVIELSFHTVIVQRMHSIFQIFRIRIFSDVEASQEEQSIAALEIADDTLDREEVLRGLVSRNCSNLELSATFDHYRLGFIDHYLFKSFRNITLCVDKTLVTEIFFVAFTFIELVAHG